MKGGWKTVTIDGCCQVGYTQGCLKVKRDSAQEELPLSEIRAIVFESLQTEVSLYLLNELRRERIKVIFCDSSHNPSAEIMAYHDHYRQSGCLRSQLAWDEKVKNEIWKKIVKNKIEMQIDLLKRSGIKIPPVMARALEEVGGANVDHCEAVAANYYFKALFGRNFSRSRPNDINAALNYGYSILLSMINRQVTASGYLTNLGIHHHSAENPYNLSCDLMEPFRPLIDEIVYKSKNNSFDKEYKNMLLKSLYNNVRFQDKRMEILTAADLYAESVLKGLNKGNPIIGEVKFYGG